MLLATIKHCHVSFVCLFVLVPLFIVIGILHVYLLFNFQCFVYESTEDDRGFCWYMFCKLKSFVIFFKIFACLLLSRPFGNNKLIVKGYSQQQEMKRMRSFALFPSRNKTEFMDLADDQLNIIQHHHFKQLHSSYIPYNSATDQGQFSFPPWSATTASITILVAFWLASAVKLKKRKNWAKQ